MRTFWMARTERCTGPRQGLLGTCPSIPPPPQRHRRKPSDHRSCRLADIFFSDYIFESQGDRRAGQLCSKRRLRSRSHALILRSSQSPHSGCPEWRFPSYISKMKDYFPPRTKLLDSCCLATIRVHLMMFDGSPLTSNFAPRRRKSMPDLKPDLRHWPERKQSAKYLNNDAQLKDRPVVIRL
jgi:hypothetical protein